MVKNISGGTKTKGLARKHVATSHASSATLRIPQNTLEQIVIVSKMLGNGMCEVFNNDDQRFIAHIRNKFKGRHRRSNDISINSFILVGLREWEKPHKNVDVIFVYDHNDFNALNASPSIHIHSLLSRLSNFNSKSNIQHNDDIIFNSIDTIDQPIEHIQQFETIHNIDIDFNDI